MRVLSGRLSQDAAFGLTAALLLVLTSCGGGGGSNKVRIGGDDITDPIIDLEGAPGRFSMTPQEANAFNGANPPPRLHTSPGTQNHYFRLEFPFRITPESFLLDDPLLAPFSYLNGNLSVTDLNGVHIPGKALINGVDVFGTSYAGTVGFPSFGGPNGQNRNMPFTDDDGVKKDVFLFVADTDDDLSTIAAFNSKGPPETNTSLLATVAISLAQVDGLNINGSWTINIGVGPQPDQLGPQVVSVVAEEPDPTNPNKASGASVNSSFLLTFNEPVVPQSVGESAQLNGFPFSGNQPVPPINIPIPNVVMTATVNSPNGSLYIPFDCVPLNNNNLATYRLRPLVMLPANQSLRLQAFSLLNNTQSAMDVSGNNYQGVDADGDGVGDDLDFTADFAIGPGPAVVNIPVSPEVVYWLPGQGRGIGAIDLNGWGFSTGTPGLHADNPAKPAIVTTSGFLNLATGIATLGHPCDTNLCIHNQYSHDVGLGSFTYGAGITADWKDAADPGNIGTLMPGLNEMSAGLDEFCRNSDGSVILSGRDYTDIGVLDDFVVGEFLDMVYRDTQNFFADDQFHASIYGGVPTFGRNVISDPPAPNPPPSRYWVGLPQIDIVVDVFDPNLTAFLIESDEVWCGVRAGGVTAPVVTGISQLIPNQDNPFGPDQTLFPHGGVGPGVQSATQSYAYSSRQQIGNFLYVTDIENKLLHALNSNTMRIISSIPLPDPRGIGIAPNNELIYVSNSDDDSLSVVDTNPMSPTFHTEVARIGVGFGPRSVAVQPDNEDVFVCNFLGDTISIVDQQTLTVRKEISALIDQPYDIVLSGRQGTPTSQAVYGFASGIFFGYVSNFGSNSLLVYESGPDGPQGIGHDNILGELPTGDADKDFIVEPRGICYAPFANEQGFDAGGVFLAHQDEEGFGRVSLIQFSNQAQFGPLPITSPPGFFIPPGFLDRNFDPFASWGNTRDNQLIGFRPSDVTVADMDVATYQQNPSGAPNFSTGFPPPNVDETGFINSHHQMRCSGGACFTAWLPDRMYVSFADRDEVQVLDPQQAGIILKTIEGGGGVGIKRLGSYWDQ